MTGTPFGSETYAIGEDFTGRRLRLGPVSPAHARELGTIFAAIDPWKKVNWPAERLERFLGGDPAGTARWLVRADEQTAGAVSVSAPWLHGAYLHFLGIVPEAQGAGIGTAVMNWFEREAQGHCRNLWICVSAFNERAERFYLSRGYVRAAILDELVAPGEDEILLRRRI